MRRIREWLVGTLSTASHLEGAEYGDAFHTLPLSKPGQGEIRDAVESVPTTYQGLANAPVL